jgi:hypothetical protein
MNVAPLADKVEAAGLGVLDTTLFINTMPDDCVAGIVLLGKAAGSPIDPEIRGYHPGAGFQATVRHASYTDGFTLIRQIMSLLTMEKTSMVGMFVNYIRPRHEPIIVPRTAGNLLEFSVNFDANYFTL